MSDKCTTIIFDLDGTLYKLRGGSYSQSPLKRYVLKNAAAYLAARLAKSKPEAARILRGILKKYKEEISIGVEKEFKLDRHDYFRTVWNIPARLVVSKERNLRRSLLALSKCYRLIIISDAPLVWIKNVLIELGVYDIFRGRIFSGESDNRKGFQSAFPYIIKSLKLKPRDCISVGDQESSDIIPAKKLGLKTVFINQLKKSTLADFNVKSIGELTELLLK
ncbi:MAG: HAD family hydrolase [Patescibacteria group bacterium]